MELNPSSKIVVSPDQVSCVLNGELFILNKKNDGYFGLNQVGASIWDQIQSPKTFQEICDAIMTEYEVTPESCVTDIRELLQDMKAADLIEVS